MSVPDLNDILLVSLLKRLCILKKYFEKGQHQDKVLTFFVHLKVDLEAVVPLVLIRNKNKHLERRCTCLKAQKPLANELAKAAVLMVVDPTDTDRATVSLL